MVFFVHLFCYFLPQPVSSFRSTRACSKVLSMDGAAWVHSCCTRLKVETGISGTGDVTLNMQWIFVYNCTISCELHVQYGWTPLFSACKRGHVECDKLLLQAGADINKASRVGHCLPRTRFLLALADCIVWLSAATGLLPGLLWMKCSVILA